LPPNGLRQPDLASQRKRKVNDVRGEESLSVVLDDADLIELARILMDDDAEAALVFLKRHFKGKSKELLEGG